MRRALLLLAVMACLAVTGCGGKTIFVKPGATAADFEQAKAECEFEATKYSYTPMGAFDSPISSGIQEGIRHNQLLFKCLEAKGWRPVQQGNAVQPVQQQEQATIEKPHTPYVSPMLTKWKGLAEQGDAHAQFELGRTYANAKDGQRALEWFQKAAERGNGRALAGLGSMYAEGNGVTKDERKATELYQKALNILQKAADKGDAYSQYGLGLIYANGLGTFKDGHKALEWFQKAADQGNADAHNELGRMYLQGRGVPKDERKAVELYQKAAAQGNTNAQLNLGILYGQGRGVPKDERKALELIQSAANQGNADAQAVLGKM